MRVFFSYVRCIIGCTITLSGLVIALYELVTWNWQWTSVSIFVGTYVVIASGITVGFHRYGTHRAFTFTTIGKWVARPFLLLAGSWAWQSSFGWWTTTHHVHHRFTDRDGDPHSPYSLQASVWRKVYQFWWAHMLWVPYSHPNVKDFFRLMKADWFERFLSQWYVYVLIGPVGAIVLTWWIGGWQGVAWYLAAVFIYWHLTASVNSVTHLFGYRRFNTKDHSTNSWSLAFLTLGESLHNNHHAAQKSARFARVWWEYLPDIGWLQIRVMKHCGLVSTIHQPSR